ncbi:MAG: hypothetical protein AAF383_00955 [Cyanobacteria bacterium P01_A01_bin.83]
MDLSSMLSSYSKKILRKGKLFNHILQQLQANEKLTYENLVEYQNRMVSLNIEKAYKEVAYYKNLLDSLKINPQEIKTIEDLKSLPILKKSSIRGQERQFVSNAWRWKFKTTTSGTTGTPVKLSRDIFSVNFEHAAIWRQRNWAKCFLNEPYVSLRGDVVISPQASEPPFWKYISTDNKLVMSSYHLSEQFIPYYIEKIRQFSPAFIEGYPSAIYRLARYMQIHDEPPIKVKAVFTSSETVLEYRRLAIEECFGSILDHYGQAERVSHIAMCEHGNYHYMMDYSLSEFLPTDDDDIYRVVGTTFHNRAMPLIRYDTGDFVVIKDFHKTCSCGRPFPVIDSIEGRQEDYILTPSGKYIGGMGIIFGGLANLVEGQIIQEKLDLIRVLIVATDNFNYQNEKLLVNNLKDRVGDDMNIIIQKTDSIERTKRGKHKLTISLVDKEKTLRECK